MFVLGVIVLGVIAFHLTHFWAEMQLLQFQGYSHDQLADPNMLMAQTFKPLWVLIVYIVWFAALWFHLTHGFWSALQTIGWNNDIWIKRWRVIGYIFATIIFLGFTTVAVVAHINAI